MLHNKQQQAISKTGDTIYDIFLKKIKSKNYTILKTTIMW